MLIFLLHSYLAAKALGYPVVTEHNVFINSASQCLNINSCRTLTNILWSCVSTILACAYTAIHKNIPGPLQTRTSIVLVQVQIIIATLLLPEWVLGWALRQCLNAHSVTRELEVARVKAKKMWDSKVEVLLGANNKQDEETSDESELRRKHAEKNIVAGITDDLVTEGAKGRLDEEYTLIHGYFVIMGGFHAYKDGKPLHPLSREEIVNMIETGRLILPSKSEIRGMGHKDWLAKFLATGQSLWFIVNCIARRVQNLPIAQLEVMTLAYTIITIGMYCVWWHKPLDVNCPVRVAVTEDPLNEPSRYRWYHFGWTMAGWQDYLVRLNSESRVPTFYSGCRATNTDVPLHENAKKAELLSNIAGITVALVFGAVHLDAWFDLFPSSLQRNLWRAGTITIIASPTLMLPCPLAWLWLRSEEKKSGLSWLLPIVFVTVGLGVFVYLFARVILIIVAFTSLTSLRPETYRTVSWTFKIPHI